MQNSLEDDRFIYSESQKFDANKSYEDYKSDVRKYLMYCSWKYSAEDASETVEMYEHFVREAYENQVPVVKIALDIGYGCG